MFCRKMTGHTHNDKLLIHCFQYSIKGSAAKWYNQLDRSRIHTWRDLGKAFLTQYKDMTDMAPDRLSLQKMEKKSTESFKEYAQRWRDLAAQVQPPLTEKERTVLFVSTLRAPYYDKLVGNATKNFADMVISGEMIENAIKSGKIEAGDTSVPKKGGTTKKKAVVRKGKLARPKDPYAIEGMPSIHSRAAPNSSKEFTMVQFLAFRKSI